MSQYIARRPAETRTMRFIIAAIAVFAVVPFAFAAEPCTSGLTPGQKPGPYSSIVSIGPQRGEPFCFICDTAEHPAAIVFARTLSDPLGKLTAGLDKAIGDQKAADLRAWVTILGDDQTALDPKVVEWGKRFALRSVPVGVFESLDGPPSYRLSRDADVTVMLFVNRKVVANFAFRAGELNDDRVADVLKALPAILPEKK
jgi:hypothetical protein